MIAGAPVFTLHSSALVVFAGATAGQKLQKIVGK
jgi:biotin transporter BioY